MNALFMHNGILLSHEKNEITLFAATWTDLNINMLSEISQIKTNTGMLSLICGI